MYPVSKQPSKATDVKPSSVSGNGSHVEPAAHQTPPRAEPEKRVLITKYDAAPDTAAFNRFKGHASAWQHDENMVSFLRRLPVDNPATLTQDGWLWVDNPKPQRAQETQLHRQDLIKLTESGFALLEAYVTQRTLLERQNLGKAAATITRRMGPYRDKLEEDILALAVKSGTTSGKWMLFPGAVDLPRYWRTVATATSEGSLGPVSKSAVFDPVSPDTLICVYTHDFTDLEDVRRVLEQLVELGLCEPAGKPIHYKCDAYTYLHLTSGSEYKLRASLYSSKEILRNEVKALAHGAVARMQKRKQHDDHELHSSLSMLAEDDT